MSIQDIKDAFSGSNHKSIGTRIGLRIDPMRYLWGLWGDRGNYDDFVNTSGDFLNSQASDVVKPIDRFARSYDPLHKEITSTQKGSDAADWVVNKPASAAGIVYGGISGIQALGGLGGGGGGGSGIDIQPATASDLGLGQGGQGAMGSFGMGGSGWTPAGDAGFTLPSMNAVGGGNAGALAANHGIAGGAGIGQGGYGASANTGGLGLTTNDYIQMGQGLAGQMGGGQQQQAPPPQRQGLGQRINSGVDTGLGKIANGLAPVDPRVAAVTDPSYVKALQGQALMKMGLGMMAAAQSGHRLGPSLMAGIGGGQEDFSNNMQDAYQRGVVDRQQQRADDRQKLIDQRYQEEQAAKAADEAQTQKNWQATFDANAQLRQAQIAALHRREVAQPPSGYRYSPDGNLEAIPGGPADKGTGLGSREGVMFQRVINSANSAATALQNISELPVGASTGVFGVGSSPGHSVLSSIKSTMMNKLSSQDVQDYNTMLAGVSRNLSTIETAGLAPNGSITSSMDSIQLREGDTEVTKLRKLAEMRQIIEKGIEANLSNPKLPKEQKDLVNSIINQVKQSIPFTQSDITKLQRKQQENPDYTLQDLIKDRVGAPSGPDNQADPLGIR